MAKLLVVEPGGSPGEIREVEDSLDSYQAIVGGYIAELNTRAGLAIVNEEKEDLPLNMTATKMISIPIYGTVIFTGGADEDGNILDYTGPQGGGDQSI